MKRYENYQSQVLNSAPVHKFNAQHAGLKNPCDILKCFTYTFQKIWFDIFLVAFVLWKTR